MDDLTRGYDQSKTNYDELLKKKNESKMATSMEQMQQGERFRMLDPPSLPLKPDFPNRLEFCANRVGLRFDVGCLCNGRRIGIPGRPALHTEQALKALLSVRVIGEIPEMSTPADEYRSSKRRWTSIAMALTVVIIIAVGSAISYLRG